MTYQVEEGLCDGRVIYHKHVQRSGAEKTAQQQAHEEKAHLKAERRRQQEGNVRRKRLELLRKEADKVTC
jgi:ribosome biogenesis protein SSF1/2